jgi:hypothetical protein
MRDTYEDPRKTELHEKCWIALDAAGYDVEPEPLPIEIPANTGLQGRIVPDLTSADGTGRITVYCLRLSSIKPLPQWLGNWSRATKAMQGVDLYVVIEDAPSQELMRSCQASGAGLLILRLEGIDRALEAGVIPEDIARAECRKRVADLRRRFENKLHLQLEAIDANFNQARSITAPFPDDLEAEYIGGIEGSGIEWRQWGDELSQRLDALAASCDEAEFGEIEALLAKGPT